MGGWRSRGSVCISLAHSDTAPARPACTPRLNPQPHTPTPAPTRRRHSSAGISGPARAASRRVVNGVRGRAGGITTCAGEWCARCARSGRARRVPGRCTAGTVLVRVSRHPLRSPLPRIQTHPHPPPSNYRIPAAAGRERACTLDSRTGTCKQARRCAFANPRSSGCAGPVGGGHAGARVPGGTRREQRAGEASGV